MKSLWLVFAMVALVGCGNVGSNPTGATDESDAAPLSKVAVPYETEVVVTVMQDGKQR